MSRDTLLKEVDGDLYYSYDNLRTQGYLDGHVSGAEAAIGFVMNRAVSEFKAGREETAIQLRRLAQAISDAVIPDLRERANVHSHQYPAEQPAPQDARESPVTE